ncbi:hypothetical protein MAR_018693 [Mya arenaria]|uniref:Uncharacterized protein n=1 Tax=Mya arenaria TaxID=6604 RepID=A0ABY7EFE4_MYAAR|nr:hypothetical protein MAR_018693 [Mya arenaria]
MEYFGINDLEKYSDTVKTCYKMETGNTDLVRRTGHQYDDLPGIGIEDLDDITYSTDEDYDDDDSNYGGDREDNDEFPDERKIVKDPGPFRYNRKMVIVSLPCAIMVLTLVGELFLMAASFGAGIIVILDPKGEKKRFVYLQLFITPHSSSFILDNKAEDSKELDDLNVVPEVVSLLMAIVYSTAPTLLYIALNVINNPLRQLFSLNVMLQLVFISALSVFLSSLMSLRAVFEFTVFTMCEVMLYKENLYSQSFLVMTAVTLLYTLHRPECVGMRSLCGSGWFPANVAGIHHCCTTVGSRYGQCGSSDIGLTANHGFLMVGRALYNGEMLEALTSGLLVKVK